MADDNQNPDTPATPSAEPAPQPAAPAASALTLESVQAMIAEATQKAHDSAYAKARREFEGKQPKPKVDAKPDPKPADVDALTIIALRDAFDDATGDLPLSAKQKKFLRDRVMKERPDDVAGFVADAVEMLGVTQAQPATPTVPAEKPAQPAQAKPAQPSPPPPAPVPDREGDPVFRALSDEAAQDMWQSYVRRKGAVPGNPYDPRNRAVWRELRNRFEAAAATTRIQLGARRG